VARTKTRIAPQIAVALYATTRSRVNSFASLSYRSSLPKMPIASTTIANIGTPSTNAANIRCTWAAIQIAPRAPISGKSPYAGASAIAS
jgi:hypothetical protein